MSENNGNNNNTNNNDGDYEVYCQMCRRGRSQVSDMFKLLDGMYICSDCMHKTMDTMGQFGFSPVNPFATGSNTTKGTPLGSIFGDLNKQSADAMKESKDAYKEVDTDKEDADGNGGNVFAIPGERGGAE